MCTSMYEVFKIIININLLLWVFVKLFSEHCLVLPVFHSSCWRDGLMYSPWVRLRHQIRPNITWLTNSKHLQNAGNMGKLAIEEWMGYKADIVTIRDPAMSHWSVGGCRSASPAEGIPYLQTLCFLSSSFCSHPPLVAQGNDIRSPSGDQQLNMQQSHTSYLVGCWACMLTL